MRAGRWIAAAALAALAAVAIVLGLELRGGALPPDATPPPADAATVARGERLARAANCIGCHTARGGVPYAGGRGIATPFGTVFAPNLTPDDATGLGRWSAAAFRRALHEGRSRDGRLLVPAFPYPEYTRIADADADAIFAFLKSLAPVAQPARPHALRFPYGSQLALAAWRVLYFRPGRFAPDPAKSAEWNRGAYLVRALGHCNACHAPRGVLGATVAGAEFAGGLVPMQGWYAPSLASPREAGVQRWPEARIVELLKTGAAGDASVAGPMAEVVARSTQFLDDADLRAMAVFLKSLPVHEEPPPAVEPDAASPARGARLYERHCASCHGDAGEGRAPAYPPLAGNRGVTMTPPVNAVRIVLEGGYPPSTAGRPRPWGMPPFGHELQPQEIADVLSFVRGAWGNGAGAVTALQVRQIRELGR